MCISLYICICKQSPLFRDHRFTVLSLAPRANSNVPIAAPAQHPAAKHGSRGAVRSQREVHFLFLKELPLFVQTQPTQKKTNKNKIENDEKGKSKTVQAVPSGGSCAGFDQTGHHTNSHLHFPQATAVRESVAACRGTCELTPGGKRPVRRLSMSSPLRQIIHHLE